jgi:hypothetical protein
VANQVHGNVGDLIRRKDLAVREPLAVYGQRGLRNERHEQRPFGARRRFVVVTHHDALGHLPLERIVGAGACDALEHLAALLGAGAMGCAIVRRVAAGRKVLFGDISEATLERVSDEFARGGHDVETCVVDALDTSSVEAFAARAAELGPVKYFIDTAGASPNQASPEHILALDMVATEHAIDAFGDVIAEGGAGLVISSQTGYMHPIPYEVSAPRPRQRNCRRGLGLDGRVPMQIDGFSPSSATRVIPTSRL